MTQYSLDEAPSPCFNPVSSMPNWTRSMRRATRAERTGQIEQAMAHYKLALANAQKSLFGAGSPTADQCLSAFVSSHLCIAALQESEGNVDGAATGLAEVHQALLHIIHQQARSSAWHQAAVWYSRDTHAALLAHLMVHGDHPAIDRALRSGCLTLCAPSVRVH